MPPEAVLPVAEVPGGLRLAAADTPIVLEWVKDFYRETLHTEFISGEACVNPADSRQNLLKEVAALYIWHDTRPVAMGMLTEVCGEGRINLIYVKPGFRKRGYGRAVVAALAGKARASGLLPVLFATPENKAANRLYMSLGFRF